MPLSQRGLSSCFLSALILSLAACGGGGSSSSSVTTPAPQPPTITSVSVSCALNSVPVAQTSQCAPNVQGTGKFNSSVTWTVNGVQGGNSTTGTVSSGGLYTAPATVPTPYTVNVTATSAQDETKSSFVSLIIAGAVGSMSQIVTAAAGGTITLPDGSSVTIPPNVLTTDQNVTLSELSAPAQPPNQLMVGVGSTLLVTFSNPIQPEARGARPRSSRGLGQSSPNDQTAPTLTFTISESTAPSGLNGSEGLASIGDTANNTFFQPITYSAQGQTAQLLVPYSDLTGFQNPVSSVAVAPVNTVYQAYPTNLPPAVALPSQLCWQPTTSSWNDFTKNCAGKVSGRKILVVVHGMMSCVEQLGTLASYMQATDPKEYDLVVGFDYDWTQHLTDNGDLLAKFLQQLSGASKIDIIAHSEGVPVSLYGASQASDRGLIKNFIGLAGPILGTPFANNSWAVEAVYLDYRGSTAASICPASTTLQNYSIQQLVQSPFVSDLFYFSQPLTSTIIPAAKQNLSATTILLAAGESEGPLYWVYQLSSSPFGSTPNDGIVGADSALAFNSGLTVHPLKPFPLFHTDLPGDSGVLGDIMKQVNASLVGTPFPSWSAPVRNPPVKES